MTVTVRLFASAREACGFERKEYTVDSPSVNGVKDALTKEFPSARALLASCRYAVNMEYAAGNHALKEGDVVAVIPPVSGG